DRWNIARRSIMDRYRGAADRDVFALVAEAAPSRAVHHLAVARTRQRAEVRHWLESWGIQTGIHYPTPIHRIGAYQQFADQPLPAVEAAADEIMSLPMWPHMSEEQIGRVCQALEL